MEEKLELFWKVYDNYITTGSMDLRGELSRLLSQVETKDKREQLFRPEKGWNNILAWQVLRDQEFIFGDYPVMLSEGEIIIWFPHWDRDVFITRLPIEEKISGRYLKPGFHMDFEDREEESDDEWSQKIQQVGITDERGLYLPLYDSGTLIKFCDQYFTGGRVILLDYLTKERVIER